MKINKKLTNNEILRNIQVITENHERLKFIIISKCKEMDDTEKEYNEMMLLLKNRMSGKE